MNNILEINPDNAEYGEFQHLIEEYGKAWTAAHDPARAEEPGRFYAKDGDLVFYDVSPFNGGLGWEDFRQESQQNNMATTARLLFTTNSRHELRVWRKGEVAWATFDIHLEATPKDGRGREVEGRQTGIFERRAGLWLLVHEHGSAPIPAGSPLGKRQDAIGAGRPAASPHDVELGNLVRDFWAAWSSRDIDRAERFYSHDPSMAVYVIFLPREGFTGWEGFRAGAERILSQVAEWTFTPYPDNLRTRRWGDLALTVGMMRLAMRTTEGHQSEGDARYTLLWERRDDGWRVVHEHLSSTPPA